MRFVIAFALASISASCFAQTAKKAEIFSAVQIRTQLEQLSQRARTGGSSGGTLGDYGTHALKLSERTASGGAELHNQFDDVMIVIDGEAALITGGELMDTHTGSNGEITGSGIRDGQLQVIRAGDVIHIPAGTPHQLLIKPGTTYSALVIKVKE